jgi:23S rRNA (adenine2503-C2)-methyltransferase
MRSKASRASAIGVSDARLMIGHANGWWAPAQPPPPLTVCRSIRYTAAMPNQPHPQQPTMSLMALQSQLADWGEPAYRGKQILGWRNKGVLAPDEMRNLPASLRQRMQSEIDCQPLTLRLKQQSVDGTRKYLFTLHSGKAIETVFIPEPERGTVCVSSQVGCVLDCPFCHTGTQRFEANLTAAEIVAQVLAVKADLRLEPVPGYPDADVTHVVYMGMGEPLANEDGVHGSLAMLLDADEGLGLSRRRITVSTSGLVPQIERLGAAYPVNLAISLHAATDALRDVLVPINRKYPLARLRQCLDAYVVGRQRHITLEYVMLDGVNDRDEDLDALARFVRPERERVNLISFNPYPGNPYHATPRERMDAFAGGLIRHGIRATVRRSRGQDIMAACGQLKSASESMAEEDRDHRA